MPRSATAATTRFPTAAIALAATPAACAPKASLKRGSRILRNIPSPPEWGRGKRREAPKGEGEVTSIKLCPPLPAHAARESPSPPKGGEAKVYAVKECFLTLQGEGLQAGRRAVFLRFSGCNLW